MFHDTATPEIYTYCLTRSLHDALPRYQCVGRNLHARRSFQLMADEPKYSPRYVAYASEHGRSPEQQLEHDREAWPGGLMCGFILWSNERLAEYAKINPAALDRKSTRLNSSH